MKDSHLNVADNEEIEALVNKEGQAKAEDADDAETYLTLFKTCFAEMTAYFFIILFIYFSGGDQTKFIFAFWSVFVIFGNLSGAHVNPIVSVALWIYKGNMFRAKNLTKLFSFIISQIIGGILAAVVANNVYKKKVVYVKPSVTEDLHDIVLCEGFFSGTFVFVCLFVSSPATRPSNKNYINLTLLSVWLYLIINAGLDISGGCYNPTVFLVLNGLAYFSAADVTAFNLAWMYILAPLVGAVIFTFLFKYVYRPYYVAKNKIITSEDDS